MQTTLENRKKVATKFLRSVLKRNNIVEEGGTSGSRVKKEQKSKNVKAQKMMRGRVEPSTLPTILQAVPTIVQVAWQTVEIPHITFPQERQPREQR
jgi:hypothetical protein